MSYLSAKQKVILKLRFKFYVEIKQKLKRLLKKNIGLNRIYTIINTSLKNIPPNAIELFYNVPSHFFDIHTSLLNDTSYYDDSGISIFAHYFNVLHLISKNENYLYSDIYKSNFDSFFREYGKYLAIQDISLETPLHKIIKMRNKNFFLEIYRKLKNINVINDKIIGIKDINDVSCFDIIINDIIINRDKIIKNNFELYNKFITDNNSLIELLPNKSKNELKLFSLKIYFDMKLFKDIKFDEMFNGLQKLLENDKDKMIEYFDPSLNYLNCLFHYCKTEDNFNKLYIFISKLFIPKTRNIKSKIKIEYYIYNHICYVLRKMKLSDETFKYIENLIKNIFPTVLSYYSYDELKRNFIKNGLKANSLVDNLAYNTYLTFDQKYKVFELLEKELNELFEENNDVANLYKVFKLYKKKLINKSSITSYFQKDEYIRKIFSDYFFIGKLYRTIYNLSYKYDRSNIKKYLKKLNEFLTKNKEIFSNYKANYGFQDKNIDIIIKIIILFEEQNCNKDMEEEYIDRKKRNDLYFKKYHMKFILTEPKLIVYYIKDIILESKKSGPNEKKKSYNDFLEIFFSFKYDFQKILTIKNLIPYFSNENKNELVFYETKLIKSLPLIKGNKDEFAIYKFILKYSPNINNKFIFESTIRKLKLLMKIYFNKLIFKWEEDCEFSELCNFINDNILLFCKLFLNLNDSLEDRKNKINFFFDEFIHVLNPEFKEKFRQYKELSLDYLNFTRDDDEYYYNCESDIYFSMMFIFIRLKFGKYNPSLLYKYLCIINSSIDTFLLFLKAYFNNSNKKDILYHFFLIDSNLSLLYPDKYKFYFKYFFGHVDRYIIKEEFVLYFFISLHKLGEIKFSLIFDYIISVFNDYNSSNENIFKFIFPE